MKLTQIPAGSKLAHALAEQVRRTPAELDEMDGSKLWRDETNPSGGLCMGSECQDGIINLVKLDAEVNEIHGGLCRKVDGLAYAYVIDNGDGIIGDGDLFAYEYYKKMPWYRPDINKHGFLRLFQPHGGQGLPTGIENVVNQIERNKGQTINSGFTKPLDCVGYQYD